VTRRDAAWSIAAVVLPRGGEAEVVAIDYE
jgi:hypothetical protein